eukprot:13397942-Ditylum_brightwellii.AAC.1
MKTTIVTPALKKQVALSKKVAQLNKKEEKTATLWKENKEMRDLDFQQRFRFTLTILGMEINDRPEDMSCVITVFKRENSHNEI